MNSTVPKMICQNQDCKKMGRYQSSDNFYRTRLSSMPYHPYCKECVNRIVSDGSMESVYDMLKMMDIPFFMDIWNECCKKTPNNPFGNYISKMNRQTKEEKELKWENSVFELSEEDDLDEVVQKKIDSSPRWDSVWQGSFTKEELDYLNNYYAGLEADFKIVTTNHKDYARKIAKASLAMDKATDGMMKGDEEAMKIYKMARENFDTLSKTAKFAESQRSANDVSLGSFGVLFDRVEKHEWIPDYTPESEDIYDKMIKQFSNIEKSL